MYKNIRTKIYLRIIIVVEFFNIILTSFNETQTNCNYLKFFNPITNVC